MALTLRLELVAQRSGLQDSVGEIVGKPRAVIAVLRLRVSVKRCSAEVKTRGEHATSWLNPHSSRRDCATETNDVGGNGDGRGGRTENVKTNDGGEELQVRGDRLFKEA